MKIITISGEIGLDVYPSDVRAQLKEANGEDIEIEIATPGGQVYPGIEIFNMIRKYLGKTTSKVTLAASMGSYMALAADKVIVEDNSIFMIHEARTGAMGTKRHHAKIADVLNSLDNLLLDKYVKKTGKSIEEMSALMKEESYFFGNEILEVGFADAIVPSKVKAEARTREVVISSARLKVEACLDKVLAQDIEFEKIAAIMAIAPEKKPVNVNVKKEGTMKLKEFLATNPEAKKEYDESLVKSKEEGKAEGKAEFENLDLNGFFAVAPEAKTEHEKIVLEARTEIETGKLSKDCVKKVGDIISSDSYGASIKNAGIKVLTGEKDYSGFEDLVAHADETNEKFKALKVKDNQPPKTPADGDLTTTKAAEEKTKASAKSLSDEINNTTGKVE